MIPIFSQEEFDDKDNPNPYIAVVTAIALGIDENLKYVNAFEVETPEKIIKFCMHKQEWNEFLSNAMKFFSDREDYEICEVIKEYKKILTETPKS